MEDRIAISDATEAWDERIGNWLAEEARLTENLQRAIQRSDRYQINRLMYHIGRVQQSLQNGFVLPKFI